MHELGLILTLSASLVAALIFGSIAHRFRLSPILGYLVAGVALGPHTPGFVGDPHAANQLAEIGVVLLMFGVGLHFHLRELLEVRALAVPGAIGQTLCATLLGTLLGAFLGWSIGGGIVLGLCVSVASTVVLIRVLTDAKRLDSIHGRIAVGWLIVEDILTVLILVLLPAIGGEAAAANRTFVGIVGLLGWSLLKVGALALIVLWGGRKGIPWIMMRAARTGSSELFTLTILAIALGIATASAIFFGVSMALGAFLAGMVVGQSKVSHQAAAGALPLRDAFAVLFFVSAGMLFSPGFLFHHPLLAIGALSIVVIAKPLIAIGILMLLRCSLQTALTVGLGLAQIGEFSFILSRLGRLLHLFPSEGEDAIVAGAIFSIALNPLLVRSINSIEAWCMGRPRLWNMLTKRSRMHIELQNQTATEAIRNDGIENHAVVVGYGPVGQAVTDLLRKFEFDPIVIDLNLESVEHLRTTGGRALYGDASRPELLEAAEIRRARYLLVTVPDFASRFAIVIAARGLNPNLRIFVRAHYVGERPMLEEVGANGACYEEAEAATALAEMLLRDVGVSSERLNNELDRLRSERGLIRGSLASAIENNPMCG